MTETLDPGTVTRNGHNGDARPCLGTAAARNLATTTTTSPLMQNITSRRLLPTLPWVPVSED